MDRKPGNGQETIPRQADATDDLAELASRGISLCRSHRWEEGLLHLGFVARSCDRAEAVPSLVYSYLGYGIAAWHGRDADGLDLCHRALAAEPSQPENYLNLAKIHLLKEDRGPAIAALDRGLALDPHHEELLHVRGELGWRRKVAVPFLPRHHLVNRLLGRPRRGVSEREECRRLALELQAARQKQYVLATRDAVTGLYNRAFLLENLDLSIGHARRCHKLVAVLFIDLDGFKAIGVGSDGSLGDSLLKSVAERIVSLVGHRGMVARVGDDELVAVLPEVRDDQELSRFAERILAGFEEPFVAGGREYWLTASSGVAVAPHHGETGRQLVRNAQSAIHHGETRGRSSCRSFSDIARHRVERRAKLESRLRHALENDELSIHFQPIHDARTRELSGTEALLRWRHPEAGFVAPSRFIPIAEETGLILPLGEWVLDAACRQWQRWLAEGRVDVPLSVNVSGHQVNYPARVAKIASILQTVGLAPSMLRLEITEHAVMQDDAQTIAALEVLKRMGVGLSLDDFGTGYSSLKVLRRVPVDHLKISESYIRDVPGSSAGTTLVAAIVALGHHLGLKIVAEGVGSEEQWRFLVEQGCDHIQGHLFSRALSAEDFSRYLAQLSGSKTANPGAGAE